MSLGSSILPVKVKVAPDSKGDDRWKIGKYDEVGILHSKKGKERMRDQDGSVKL